MTLRHIRIFVEIYRTCNITRASAALHMTQPAVTRALQELEQTYHIRLFERMYHRLIPTEGARQLYLRALYLLESFDRIEDELKSWDEHGLLRVGATVTLGSAMLPGLVKRFAELYPKTRLEVQVANGSALTDALCENRLDLALLENGISSKDLRCEYLGLDQLCAAAATDSPWAGTDDLTPQQLADSPLLVREKGSTARAVLEAAMEEAGLPFHPAWESVSVDALVQAARLGLGVAILPESIVRQCAREGSLCLRQIQGMNLQRRHILVWHKEKYITPLMQQFFNLCRDRL